jgi:cell division protein FtsB
MTHKQPHLNFKKTGRWISVIIVCFAAGFLFIGKDNIIHLYSSHLNVKKTERKIEEARAEIDSLALESKRLKTDTSYIEKIAREKLGLAGKKEKVYKFIESK